MFSKLFFLFAALAAAAAPSGADGLRCLAIRAFKSGFLASFNFSQFNRDSLIPAIRADSELRDLVCDAFGNSKRPTVDGEVFAACGQLGWSPVDPATIEATPLCEDPAPPSHVVYSIIPSVRPGSWGWDWLINDIMRTLAAEEAELQ